MIPCAESFDLVSGTNFDTAHVSEIAAAAVTFATLQVQYSVLDQRPAEALTECCRQFGTKLLCYGALAGGFLSDRWLGESEPINEISNRSLFKYKSIIDDFGEWAPFQPLLQTLRDIDDIHDNVISVLASRYVLEMPLVAGVVVSARNAGHLGDALCVGEIHLSADDRDLIAGAIAQGQGIRGEVYGLERGRNGRHGSIVKYNLADVETARSENNSQLDRWLVRLAAIDVQVPALSAPVDSGAPVIETDIALVSGPLAMQ